MKMGKNLNEKIKCNIAGYTVSLHSNDCSIPSRRYHSYQSFSGGEKSDIELKLVKSAFNPPSAKKIFHMAATWRLLTHDNKNIFQIFEDPKNKTPCITASFDHDYRKGTIYLNPEQTGESEFPDPLSYPLDELLMTNFLSRNRGLIVHSFGLSDHHKNGLLFIGQSGAGKSTMANLWKKKNNAELLSDDRIVIRKKSGRFAIYGTPWHGDAGVASPGSAPLKKIFFIKKAEKNYFHRLGLMDASSRLMVCCFPPFWDKKGMEFTLQFIDEIVQNIPCYELGFEPNESIVEFVKGIE